MREKRESKYTRDEREKRETREIKNNYELRIFNFELKNKKSSFNSSFIIINSKLLFPPRLCGEIVFMLFNSTFIIINSKLLLSPCVSVAEILVYRSFSLTNHP